MRKPRFWNRRGFTPSAAGYFSVLREDGWFSAAPLPEGYRYSIDSEKKPARALLTPTSAALFGIAGEVPPILQWYRAPQHGLRRLVRLGVIVLLAAGLMYLLLALLGHPWGAHSAQISSPC